MTTGSYHRLPALNTTESNEEKQTLLSITDSESESDTKLHNQPPPSQNQQKSLTISRSSSQHKTGGGHGHGQHLLPAVIMHSSRVQWHVDTTFVASTWAYIGGTLCWWLYHLAIELITGDDSTNHVEEGGNSCELGSAKYYALCGFGGVLSCGITHTAVTPLDMIKCRIQVDPKKYRNPFYGWKLTVKEGGARALVRGWAPTCIGYSLQGLGKFGFYEVFKIIYGNMLGEELAFQWRTTLFLAASASAEFFADIMLAPMEAAKVRIQTSSSGPTTLRTIAPVMWKAEGIRGFYKGLPPLWMRQIPYTMMKFACFERTIEALYKYVVKKPRDQVSKPEQLLWTFVAGYIAGVFCAIVSHPPDTVVSKLNQNPGAGAIGIAKELGWKGLWGGLTTRIVMIGTLTALQWFIYDSVKVWLRLPRPPPPEMPASLRAKLEAAGKIA